jgi:hypothetical protein
MILQFKMKPGVLIADFKILIKRISIFDCAKKYNLHRTEKLFVF